METPQEYAELLGVEPKQITALQLLPEQLLPWFAVNKREMEWRSHPTPYNVWLSEIMLQQTRVQAVREYFARFTSQVPDIFSLATTPEDALLKLWEGLGYYNRVRNLKKGAQKVVEQWGGNLPADYDALLTIPGIGPYTAGAIASIAFGIAAPAVDGNVYRVISRFLGSYANVDDTLTKRILFELVQHMIPTAQPGDFNQSLMELGATVCRPNGFPFCGQCPLENHCAVAHQSWAAELPVKNPPKKRKIEERTLLILHHNHKVFLEKRSPQGLLPNLWQPLNLTGKLKKRELQEYLQTLQIPILQISALPPSKHIFSHIEWHLSAWFITAGPAPHITGGQWVSSLADHSLPSAFAAYRSIIEDLLTQG